MPLDPKDPRLADPKFQEFEDFVCHVLDKREVKREDERKAKEIEDAKKPKSFFDFLPW